MNNNEVWLHIILCSLPLRPYNCMKQIAMVPWQLNILLNLQLIRIYNALLVELHCPLLNPLCVITCKHSSISRRKTLPAKSTIKSSHVWVRVCGGTGGLIKTAELGSSLQSGTGRSSYTCLMISEEGDSDGALWGTAVIIQLRDWVWIIAKVGVGRGGWRWWMNRDGEGKGRIGRWKRECRILRDLHLSESTATWTCRTAAQTCPSFFLVSLPPFVSSWFHSYSDS